MPLDNAPALQRCGKTTSRFRLSGHVCPEPVLAKQCSAHIGQLKTRVVSVSAAHRDLPERQTAHDRQHDDDRRGLLHPRVRCATTKHQNAPSRSSDPQLRSSAKTGSGRAHEKLPELKQCFVVGFGFAGPKFYCALECGPNVPNYPVTCPMDSTCQNTSKPGEAICAYFF